MKNMIMHIIRFGVIVVATITLALNTGCGTFSTRMGNNQFGAPPYGAIIYDVDVVANRQPTAKWLAAANIPCDFILDTICLPIDLCFWAVGQEKDGFLSGVH